VGLGASAVDALPSVQFLEDREVVCPTGSFVVIPRALDDIFAAQDELTISVVGLIEPMLRGWLRAGVAIGSR
jgi:hypothetical protein